jgi:single-stranded DNA-binding protein
MNVVILTGMVHAEPTISYSKNGKPQTLFELVVRNEDNPQFHTQESVLIVGTQAEALFERLEAGNEVEIQGRLQRGQVVCFKVHVRASTLAGEPVDERSDDGEGDSMSDAPANAPEPAPKARRRSYPKQAMSGGFSSN